MNKISTTSNCGRFKQPFVSLNRIDDREHNGKVRENQQNRSSSRKRNSNLREQSQSLEELENASTIMNKSCQPRSSRRKEDGGKRPR